MLVVAIRRIPYLASQAEDETCKGGGVGEGVRERRRATDIPGCLRHGEEEKNKAEETRGDPPPQHTRNRGQGGLFSLLLWGKNVVKKSGFWVEETETTLWPRPDGCRRVEGGTVNSSLPGSAERRRNDFRPCPLSSLSQNAQS